MRKWAMRILGLLNVLFPMVGILYYIADLQLHFQKWPAAAYGLRDWAVFSALSLCTLLMVSLLAYFGIRLVIGDKTALRSTAMVFAAEVCYYFADVAIFWRIFPTSMAHIAIGFWERAWDLIAPQIITAYPLFGIIACVILSKTGTGVAISSPK